MTRTDRPRVVLATSNGTGMGHLSRQLAVALALGPQVEAVVWSMSQAVPVVAEAGIPFEYCPGINRGWIPQKLWHAYVRDRLVALVEEWHADVVVFDGVAPYAGVLAARQRLGGIPFVWSRRGMWRAGRNEAALLASAAFDVVIEPGDLGADGDRGATAGRTDALRIPPVSLIDVVPRLTRAQARAALGLDADAPTALVTLGSGALGDSQAAADAAIGVLAADPTWQIALTRSSIATSADEAEHDDRVIPVRGVYPLVRHLDAFDLVVSAAGYNAAHEFVAGGVPTLLVPNALTMADDQVSRARALAAKGLALLAPESSPAAVAEMTTRLMDPAVRSGLATATGALPSPLGGAAEFAGVISGLAARRLPDGSAFTSHRASSQERWEHLRRRALVEAQAALGPTASNRIRRRRGTPEAPTTGRRLRLRTDAAAVGDAPLLAVLEDVGTNDLAASTPVEHLLPGVGPAYHRRREEIWRRAYDMG